MELGPADSGRTHHLRLGESITIRLSESGGTAFVWHIEHSDGLIVNDRVETPLTAADPGAQTGRVFTVTPQNAGTSTLRLVRYRPWETPVDGDADFVLTVVADAGPVGASEI